MPTIVADEAAEKFYKSALAVLDTAGPPFLVGGAYAMREYANVIRDTKDLDIFCKAGDCPRLLQALADAGYRTEITDATWLAKAFDSEYLVDLITGSANGVSFVDDSWFEHARPARVVGHRVKLVSAEDQLWQKAFVQDRYRNDGADVAHLIRHWGANLDWRRLLNRMEAHWELLFAHVMQFRYVYPADRDRIPEWLVEELVERLQAQQRAPVPTEKVCRGPLLSRTQYLVDIEEWGYRER